MADNIIKRFFNSTVNKSYGVSLPSYSSISLETIGDFFSFSTGKTTIKKYTKSYGENPLLYMVVKKIAFTSGSINRIAVNEQGDEITSSKVLDLINKPNSEQGRIEFLEQVNEYLCTTGNCFIHYVKGIGMGEELIILKAQNVVINCDSLGMVVSYTYSYPSNGGTKEIKYDTEDILHLKTSNIVNVDELNVKYGLSPLQAAWIVVQSSSEKFKAEASIFKNRGIIGILTNATDTPILPQERERLQGEFDQEMGGADKFNKVKISSSKLNYIQTGMSPSDLKLLEGIVSSLRIICSVYGMPSVLFNDNERSTFNNFEQAVKIAFNDVYIPLGNKVDRELSRFLNNKLNTNEFIRIDLTSIDAIKGSTNEVLQALNSMGERLGTIAIQSMTDDEVRDIIGLPVLTDGQETIVQSAQPTPNDTSNG